MSGGGGGGGVCGLASAASLSCQRAPLHLLRRAPPRRCRPAIPATPALPLAHLPARQHACAHQHTPTSTTTTTPMPTHTHIPHPSCPGEMPSIVFFPILPFIMVVGLVVYWVAVTAVLYSAGDATPNYRNPSAYTPFTFKELALSVSALERRRAGGLERWSAFCGGGAAARAALAAGGLCWRHRSDAAGGMSLAWQAAGPLPCLGPLGCKQPRALGRQHAAARPACCCQRPKSCPGTDRRRRRRSPRRLRACSPPRCPRRRPPPSSPTSRATSAWSSAPRTPTATSPSTGTPT